jgi:hypothetical protein
VEVRTDRDGRVVMVVPSSSDCFVLTSDTAGRADVSWSGDEQTIRLTPR